MQRLLSVFLLFVCFPFGAFAHKEPLPPELIQARAVYIKLADFIPTRRDQDNGAKASYMDPCYGELAKWGRWKVVVDPKDADIILRISSQADDTHTGIADSHGRNITTVTTPGAMTTIDVLQPTSGKRLWVGSQAWVWAFTAKLTTRNIVNSLRRDVEAQAKESGKRNSNSKGDTAADQPMPVLPPPSN